MKKLLLSSIVLFLFSIAMILFQFSCKKEAKAQQQNSSSQYLNKILYVKNDMSGNTFEVWIANIDGSSSQKIPVNLPSGLYFGGNVYLTPDGKKIVFTVGTENAKSKGIYIYTCNIDGSSLAKVIDNTDPGNVLLEVAGAY